MPVPRDIHAFADPNVVALAGEVVEELGQGGGAAGSPDQPAVQSDGHHFGRALPPFLRAPHTSKGKGEVRGSCLYIRILALLCTMSTYQLKRGRTFTNGLALFWNSLSRLLNPQADPETPPIYTWYRFLITTSVLNSVESTFYEM